MTEVLLKELTSSDIDWILATGQREEITAGTTLIRQGAPVNALYILLDGALSISVAQPDDNPIGRAFAALEGGGAVRTGDCETHKWGGGGRNAFLSI